ncbi:MAG: hypothetical protein OQJ78_02425 [Ignavibacteriaceae bacterium]|nr:hypothetical protein [Ignavibacteriaceae bacterium]
MTEILDIIGSVIIVGIAMLIVANINFSLNASVTENIYSNVMHFNITATAQQFEHDFYKMGFRVKGQKIVEADSSKIKFYTDIDDNGNIDSVIYHIGDTAGLDSTPNPNDKILYRTINQSTTEFDYVTNLKFTYYDSLSNEIDYASLTNPSWRKVVRSIQIELNKGSAELINNEFKETEWNKVINPVNL